jgi:hypothetical protein
VGDVLQALEVLGIVARCWEAGPNAVLVLIGEVTLELGDELEAQLAERALVDAHH